MTNQVKNMFEEVKMPEESVEKIRRAMAEKAARSQRRPAGRRAAIAAVLTALVLSGAVMNTQVRAAVEALVKRYVFNDGRTVVEKREDGVTGMSHVSHGSSMELYVQVREDGRMYFTANGENLDITDETSMEKPFLYTYVDQDGVEHLFIVGGTPENHGIHEFFRETGGNQEWIAGYGESYLDMDTERAYPWLAAGWEELGIPWPLPGSNEGSSDSTAGDWILELP